MLVIHNYRDVVNYAIMRYLDQETQISYYNDKIFIDINNTKIKKTIQCYIIDGLLDRYMFNKDNLLINTCNPLNNWREPLIDEDISKHNNKYQLTDDSVYIDPILFNRFLDNLFKKIPKIINKEYELDNNNIRYLINKKRQFKLLQFENIDAIDLLTVFKNHYRDLSITILENMIFNYNIIEDNNNVVYIHGGNIDITLLEQIRLTLMEKGIL